MSILDKFGIPIANYTNFPNDLHVNNIEFGAGRNDFGKREYPNCYVTDLSFPGLLSYFTEFQDSITEYHYLDNICDFYNTTFDRKFENIILCNPYNYGYKALGDAKKFFDRAGDILVKNGKIHILGKSNNPWCKKESFDKFIKNDVIIAYQSKYDFELESFESLNDIHEINLKYRFYSTGLEKETIPNERLTIKKL